MIVKRSHLATLTALCALCLITSSAALAAQDHAAVMARLSTLVPDLDEVVLRDTPVADWVEVRLGAEVVYVSRDGRYLMQGRLIDLETQADLTDASRSEMRQALLAALDRSALISFGAEQPEHELLVFTDPDCGFCRRLHEQVQGYAEAGIRIHYLAFPRAGVGSATYDTLVSVWCADDRHAAMDVAKAGRTPAPARCDNPVAEHYQLGQALGVTGTPALVTSDGMVIPGFVPPDQLRSRLDSLARSAP